MNPIALSIAKAAGFGAIIGVGKVLVFNDIKPKIFFKSVSISAVAFVALKFISIYFGATIALGALVGAFVAVIKSHHSQTMTAMIGGAILGGCGGYLAGFLPPPSGWFFIL